MEAFRAGSSAGDGPVERLAGAAFDAVVASNLKGTSLVASAAWPALAAGRGSIVVVSSVLGLSGGGPFRSHAYIMSTGWSP